MSILMFLVFGLVVGLIARAVMPGRQAMGLGMTTLLVRRFVARRGLVRGAGPSGGAVVVGAGRWGRGGGRVAGARAGGALWPAVGLAARPRGPWAQGKRSRGAGAGGGPRRRTGQANRGGSSRPTAGGFSLLPPLLFLYLCLLPRPMGALSCPCPLPLRPRLCARDRAHPTRRLGRARAGGRRAAGDEGGVGGSRLGAGKTARPRGRAVGRGRAGGRRGRAPERGPRHAPLILSTLFPLPVLPTAPTAAPAPTTTTPPQPSRALPDRTPISPGCGPSKQGCPPSAGAATDASRALARETRGAADLASREERGHRIPAGETVPRDIAKTSIQQPADAMFAASQLAGELLVGRLLDLLRPAHHDPGAPRGFSPGDAAARPCVAESFLVCWAKIDILVALIAVPDPLFIRHSQRLPLARTFEFHLDRAITDSVFELHRPAS
jgi:hypothetical protein